MNYRKNKNWKKKPFMILFVIAGIATLVAVLMLLLNAVLPDVINVTEINYWQALGIFTINKILFGGFGKGPMRGRGGKNKYKEKFMQMSDEEKASFKSEWKSRWEKK